MTVQRWEPGQAYQADDIVQRTRFGAVTPTTVANGDFETGDLTNWSDLLSAWSVASGSAFEGTYHAETSPTGGGDAELVNTDTKSVFEGQIITMTAKVKLDSGVRMRLGLRWQDSGAKVDDSWGNYIEGPHTGWVILSVSGVAPRTADEVVAVIACGAGPGTGRVDDLRWDHFTQTQFDGFIFKATTSGLSGNSEPVWPTTLAGTVVDNDITWEAVEANVIAWKAEPILLSGASEPTWPTEEGAVVEDNRILWEADSGRVRDENCPNTKQVAIAAGKVFAGDDDIVAFSATVNPLDWSTREDAGFIPFGLNNYGADPVSALGIYRSNLVIFNDSAFQMWQVDADPQNFAILDAVPVGCPYQSSLAPVSNDLVFLTPEGIRSMGIAGASTNLQAGYFGKQIDPLITEALAGMSDADDILAFFYPGAGQFWMVFDDEAFVLTMNGGKSDQSWSKYTFPSAIDDATLKDGELYLRSGNKVWYFDESAVQDDVGGANATFTGEVTWPYLDFGALGTTKNMIGFDVVADGTFTASFGWDQKNDDDFTTPYSISGDTLTGDIIPLELAAPSIKMKLVFAGDEAWEWSASTIYLKDWRVTS